MLVINSHQPYPGTEADCIKTPALRHLLDDFQTVKVYSNYSLIQFNFQFFSRKQLPMSKKILIQILFIINLWKAFDTFIIHSPMSYHFIEYDFMYFYWHERMKFKEEEKTRTQKKNSFSMQVLKEQKKKRMQFISFFLLLL